MLTINEILVLRELAYFVDLNGINKSKLAREVGVTPKTVRNIINKFKEYKIDVRR